MDARVVGVEGSRSLAALRRALRGARATDATAANVPDFPSTVVGPGRGCTSPAVHRLSVQENDGA